MMERPFFSLAKTPRIRPILYKTADVEVQVLAMPAHGIATIWDADILIWSASQIVAAENIGLTTSRFFRFTPYHLLRAIGKLGELNAASAQWPQYLLVHRARCEREVRVGLHECQRIDLTTHARWPACDIRP